MKISDRPQNLERLLHEKGLPLHSRHLAGCIRAAGLIAGKAKTVRDSNLAFGCCGGKELAKPIQGLSGMICDALTSASAAAALQPQWAKVLDLSTLCHSSGLFRFHALPARHGRRVGSPEGFRVLPLFQRDLRCLGSHSSV
jgi:hypothetical protein